MRILYYMKYLCELSQSELLLRVLIGQRKLRVNTSTSVAYFVVISNHFLNEKIWGQPEKKVD